MANTKQLAGPHTDHCFTGVKHTGQPTGRIADFGGLATYVAEPKSGETKGILLFFSDVHGPFYINNQLLQDYFAENGFLVLGVDYFFGDPIDKHDGEIGFDKKAWIDKSRAGAKEKTPNWLRAVREHYGKDKKYTAMGYCFGGPFALDMAGTDEVVAAGFAHPAFLDEGQFRKVKKPLLILAAETDSTFPAEQRHKAENILTEVKASFHIQLFSGVVHGFAVRGDPEVENSRWAKEEAASTVVNFFGRFAKG